MYHKEADYFFFLNLPTKSNSMTPIITTIKKVRVVAENNVEEYVIGPRIFAIMNSDSSNIRPIAIPELIIVILGWILPKRIPS
jgi:hypothetical protein